MIINFWINIKYLEARQSCQHWQVVFNTVLDVLISNDHSIEKVYVTVWSIKYDNYKIYVFEDFNNISSLPFKFNAFKDFVTSLRLKLDPKFCRLRFKHKLFKHAHYFSGSNILVSPYSYRTFFDLLPPTSSLSEIQHGIVHQRHKYQQQLNKILKSKLSTYFIINSSIVDKSQLKHANLIFDITDSLPRYKPNDLVRKYGKYIAVSTQWHADINELLNQLLLILSVIIISTNSKLNRTNIIVAIHPILSRISAQRIIYSIIAKLVPNVHLASSEVKGDDLVANSSIHISVHSSLLMLSLKKNIISITTYNHWPIFSRFSYNKIVYFESFKNTLLHCNLKTIAREVNNHIEEL